MFELLVAVSFRYAVAEEEVGPPLALCPQATHVRPDREASRRGVLEQESLTRIRLQSLACRTKKAPYRLRLRSFLAART